MDSERYTVGRLARDLAQAEGFQRLAAEAELAAKGSARRDLADHHTLRAAQLGQTAAERSRELCGTPGAGRLEAVCIARSGEFTAVALRRLAAELAVARGVDLAEMLETTPDDLVALLVAPAAAISADPARGKPRGTVNGQMLDLMLREPETRGWTCKQWADRLECAKSTVAETAAWKQLEQFRQELRAARAMDRSRNRKRIPRR